VTEGSQSVLLHVDVAPDAERGRVILSISRSDSPVVLRGLLTPSDVRSLAGRMLSAARALEASE
jgi:hypothetical protein